MKLETLAGATLMAMGCSGNHAASTTTASEAPDDCAVRGYVTQVADQAFSPALPQQPGFESTCGVEGESPGRAIVCRVITVDEEDGAAVYDQVTSQIATCLVDWEQDAGDTDPAGAPETYRWTSLTKAGAGAGLQVRLHWYQDRLVVDLEVRPG